MDNPEDLLAALDVKKAVIEAFECLTTRERTALYYFFFTTTNLNDTGKLLDYPVSGTRVRQIKEKALRKVRYALWQQEDKREHVISSYKENYSL